MTLDAILDSVRDRHTQVAVYAPAVPEAVAHLAVHNAEIEHQPLPPGGPDPFLAIRENGQFRGALAVADLEALLTPPIHRPGSADVSAGYRALFALLDGMVFTALDRRQLLAVSREIEDRALRTGEGVLRAGFQTHGALAPQVELYERLGDVLTVHVYGPSGGSPAIEDVTYHPSDPGEVGRFWALAFDGGGDETRACGLLAEVRDGDYEGFWTDDPDVVGEIADGLAGL